MKYIFFSLILFFSFSVISLAEERHFIKGDDIRGAYVRVEDIEVKISFFYDTIGNVVFLSNPKSYSLGNNVFDLKENFSKDDYRKIAALVNYGYNYSDHGAQKWYVVTQYLIWQEIYGADNVHFIENFNGDIIDKYDEEINELKDLVKWQDLTPSFYQKELNVGLKEEREFIDKNNVLNFFTISHDNTEIEENKLLIKPNSIKMMNLSLINDGQRFDTEFQIYENDNCLIFVPGKFIFQVLDIKINVSYGILNIEYIQDEIYCSSCTSHIYRLYGENENYIQDIDVLNFNSLELAPGNYILKDYSRDDGIFKDENVYQFVIKDNIKTNLVINEKRVFNIITLNKIIGKELDDECIWKVYDQEALVLTITDNKSFNLGYGDYIIKQVAGNKNFDFSEIPIKVRTSGLEQNKKVNGVKKVNIPNTAKNSYWSSFLLIIGGFLIIKCRKN